MYQKKINFHPHASNGKKKRQFSILALIDTSTFHSSLKEKRSKLQESQTVRQTCEENWTSTNNLAILLFSAWLLVGAEIVNRFRTEKCLPIHTEWLGEPRLIFGSWPKSRWQVIPLGSPWKPWKPALSRENHNFGSQFEDGIIQVTFTSIS